MSAPPSAIRNAWNDSGPVDAPDNVFTVELARESLRKKFGVTFSEYGLETDHIVSAIAPSGVANGLLSVGDRVLSVNGQTAARLSHDALGLLFKKHLVLALDVEKGDGRAPQPETLGSTSRKDVKKATTTRSRGFRSEKAASGTRKFNNARGGGGRKPGSFMAATAASQAKQQNQKFTAPKSPAAKNMVTTAGRIPTWASQHSSEQIRPHKSAAQRREDARNKSRPEPWHANQNRGKRGPRPSDFGPTSTIPRTALSPEKTAKARVPLSHRSPARSPQANRTAGADDRAKVTGTIALPDGKFGFSIRGGIDKMDGGVFISDCKPNGNLERDGRFGVGDEILAINGVAVGSLTHKEVIKVFRANRARVSLSVLSAQVGVGEETPKKTRKSPSPSPSPLPALAEKAVRSPVNAVTTASTSMGTDPMPIQEEVEVEEDRDDWGTTTSLSPQKAAAPSAGEQVATFRTTVERPNTATSFGFELGTIDDGTQVIARVTPESAADDADLQKGDLIVSVNNIPVASMSHVELIQAIMQLTSFEIEVHRDGAPADAFDHTTTIEAEAGEVDVLEVTLKRDQMDHSYGFGLGTATTGEQIISRISPGGVAEGHLMVGDMVTMIDGHPTSELAHDDAIAIMISGLNLVLEVERHVEAHPEKISRHASISEIDPSREIAQRRDSIGTNKEVTLPEGVVQTVQVLITRPGPESSFGFGLATAETGEKLVSKVSDGGLAVGKLHPADIIREVNGQHVKELPHGDVVALMGAASSLMLTIDRRIAHDGRRGSITTVAPSINVISRKDSIGKTTIEIPDGGEMKAVRLLLERKAMNESFGFGLGTSVQGDKVISKITPGGPAVDILTVGDMVVAVNGQAVKGMVHDDVISVMVSGLKLCLDVARRVGGPPAERVEAGAVRRESVGRPAGLQYTVVVLARQAGQPFGFQIYTDITKGPGKYITGVIPGGVSDGALRENDLLVSLDGHDVSSVSVNDVINAMEQRLRVEVGVQRDPNNALGTIQTFQVQITRPAPGASFGFAIVTDDQDPNSPNKIGGVAADGPAANVLQVDDVVVGINGLATADLSHDETVNIVQTTDVVTLIVERSADPAAAAAAAGAAAAAAAPAREEPETQTLAVAPSKFMVEIERTSLSQSFGFGLGTTINEARVITKVSEGGLAVSKLQVGDQVVMVNGLGASDLTHDQMIEEICSGMTVQLAIERTLKIGTIDRRSSITTVQPNSNVRQRRDSIGAVSLPAGVPVKVNVQLMRMTMDASFGFGLGSTENGDKLITRISPGGVAEEKLQTGDMISMINGRNAAELTHAEAIETMCESIDLNLSIERRVTQGDAVRRGSITTVDPNAKVLKRRDSVGKAIVSVPAGQPQESMIQLSRTSNDESFGFGLGSTADGQKVITRVSPGGIAEGTLLTADKVLMINGADAQALNHKEAIAKMCEGLSLTLGIERRVGLSGDRRASISVVEPTRKMLARRDSIGKPIIEVPAGVPQESMVQIQRSGPDQSFGFGLGSTAEGQKVVTRISEGGIAEDVLQTGDLILMINGVSASTLDHKEAIATMCQGLALTLGIERRVGVSATQRRGSITSEEPTRKMLARRDSIGKPIITVPAGVPQESMVQIQRSGPDQSFGFGLGTTATGEKVVTRISEGGIAEDVLQTGDLILMINGVSASTLDHKEAIAKMCEGNMLTLGIERRVGVSATQRRGSITSEEPARRMLARRDSIGKPIITVPAGLPQEFQVRITRNAIDQSFGFGLGTAAGGEKVVTRISEGGLAEGNLETADIILAINGKDATGMAHAQAIGTMCEDLELTLSVMRRVNATGRRGSITTVNPGANILKRRDSIGKPQIMLPAGKPAQFPVEIVRGGMNESYGFGMGTAEDGEKVITTVREVGVSANLLQVGDILCEIEGVDAHTMSHAEALVALTSSTRLHVVVQRRMDDESIKQISRRASISTVDPSRKVLKRRDSVGRPTVTVPAGRLQNLKVVLIRQNLGDSFGFGMGTAESGEKCVTAVTPGGVSDGKLRIADILRHINGAKADPLSHDQALATLTTGKTLTLDVERRSGSPGSGSGSASGDFAQNMKRQSSGIGKIEEGFLAHAYKVAITVRRPPHTSYGIEIGKLTELNGPVQQIITNITPGSAAEKAGLCIGDGLLTINNQDVHGAEHDAIVEFIQDTPSVLEMVVLRNSDGNDGVPLFSVEIARPTIQQSWGFSIGESTTGHQVIENIAPGSVATGHLIPGDHITSINGAATEGANHDRVVAAVKQATTLKLEVMRFESPVKISRAPPQKLRVLLSRSSKEQSYGFNLGQDESGAFVVSGVAAQGLSDGKLKPGDQIVAFNGESTQGMAHADAVRRVVGGLQIEMFIVRPTADVQMERDVDVQVNLQRAAAEQSWGFGLGESDDGSKVISTVKDGGISSGKLIPQDVILSINGTATAGLDHSAVVGLVVAGNTLAMVVRRTEQVAGAAAAAASSEGAKVAAVSPEKQIKARAESLGHVIAGTITVILSRPDLQTSYGFGLGEAEDGTKVVSTVKAGGVSSGKLQVADVIRSINGAAVTGVAHSTVVGTITAGTHLEVVLTRQTAATSRGLSRMDSISKVQPNTQIAARADNLGEGSTDTVEVVMDRPTLTTSWGFGVGETEGGETMVTSVRDGTSAAGKLHANDNVRKLNGISIVGMAHNDIINVITSTTKLRVVIQRKDGSAGKFKRQGSITQVAPKTKMAIRSDQLSSQTRVSILVTLNRPDKESSFGFGIGETAGGDLIISTVRPGGPADGKLQVGDFLHMINNRMSKSLNHEGAVEQIKSVTELTLGVLRGADLVHAKAALTASSPSRENLQKVNAVPADAPEATVAPWVEATVTVSRSVTSQSWGIGLGEDESNGQKLITKVEASGPCAGQLMVGDRVKAVNGKEGLNHADMVKIIGGSLKIGFVVLRTEAAAAAEAPGKGPIRQDTISKREPKTHVTVRADGIGDGGVNSVSVELVRENLQASFGFGIGNTEDGQFIITKTAPGGVSDGKLQVSDRVVSVNGSSTSSMTHKDIVGHITSGLRCHLNVVRQGASVGYNSDEQIDRRASISTVEPGTKVNARADHLGKGTKEEVKATLVRDDASQSWGFGLAESTAGEKLVSQIAEGGISDGPLQVADIIVQVNGENVLDMPHSALVNILQQAQSVELVVARESGTTGTWQRKGDIEAISPEKEIEAKVNDVGHFKSEQVELHLKRPSEQDSWGFGLAEASQGAKLVSSVADGGICDGKLMSGDVLLSINGQDVIPMQHADVVQIVVSNTVLDMIVDRQAKDYQIARANTLSKVNRRSRVKARADSLGEGDNEVTCSLVRKDGESFGFALGLSEANAHLVTVVNPGTPAEGSLRLNDEVLSINGKAVTGMSHADVVERIKASLVMKMVVTRGGATSNQIVVIERSSPAQSFGFAVAEHPNVENCTIITSVLPGGLADGLLRAGDRMVGINELTTEDSTHATRVEQIKASLSVKLSVVRNGAPPVTPAAEAAPEAANDEESEEVLGDGLETLPEE